MIGNILLAIAVVIVGLAIMGVCIALSAEIALKSPKFGIALVGFAILCAAGAALHNYGY